jgi:predicted RNA-binding protein YlqC (UPF0109 family)
MTDVESTNAVPTAQVVLDYVVKAVVSRPDDVEVHVDSRRTPVRLDVRVGDGDMGRVVGKRGRTAHAIRTVVRAAAARDGADVDVEFVD